MHYQKRRVVVSVLLLVTLGVSIFYLNYGVSEPSTNSPSIYESSSTPDGEFEVPQRFDRKVRIEITRDTAACIDRVVETLSAGRSDPIFQYSQQISSQGLDAIFGVIYPNQSYLTGSGDSVYLSSIATILNQGSPSGELILEGTYDLHPDCRGTNYLFRCPDYVNCADSRVVHVNISKDPDASITTRGVAIATSAKGEVETQTLGPQDSAQIDMYGSSSEETEDLALSAFQSIASSLSTSLDWMLPGIVVALGAFAYLLFSVNRPVSAWLGLTIAAALTLEATSDGNLPWIHEPLLIGIFLGPIVLILNYPASCYYIPTRQNSRINLVLLPLAGIMTNVVAAILIGFSQEFESGPLVTLLAPLVIGCLIGATAFLQWSSRRYVLYWIWTGSTAATIIGTTNLEGPSPTPSLIAASLTFTPALVSVARWLLGPRLALLAFFIFASICCLNLINSDGFVVSISGAATTVIVLLATISLIILMTLWLTGRTEVLDGSSSRPNFRLHTLIAATVGLCITFLDGATIGGLAAAISAAILFVTIVLSYPGRIPSDLQIVSPEAHRNNLLNELTRRRLSTAAKDQAEALGKQLSQGEIEPDQYITRQRLLENTLAPFNPSTTALISPTRSALGTTGGRLPSENARSAVLFAMLACLPAVVTDITLAAYQTAFPAVLAVVIPSAGRWFVYACIFGYYYSRLRCDTPTLRCVNLLIAIGIPEVLLAFSTSEFGQSSPALALLRIGQSFLFAIALGLYWERRTALAAGVSWNRVRNFRGVRGFTTPIAAILIAAATTAATAFATAAIALAVKTPSDTPTTPSSSKQEQIP